MFSGDTKKKIVWYAFPHTYVFSYNIKVTMVPISSVMSKIIRNY